jgi:hypothetical protein
MFPAAVIESMSSGWRCNRPLTAGLSRVDSESPRRDRALPELAGQPGRSPDPVREQTLLLRTQVQENPEISAPCTLDDHLGAAPSKNLRVPRGFRNLFPYPPGTRPGDPLFPQGSRPGELEDLLNRQSVGNTRVAAQHRVGAVDQRDARDRRIAGSFA